MRSPRMWFDRVVKDAKIEGFRWHDLRHTFASRLRQKGVKLEDIAEALGHKSLMMSKRYAHLGPKGYTTSWQCWSKILLAPKLAPSF